MTEYQQTQCVGLLLAIAMDGKAETSKKDIQERVKKFLETLYPADIAKAAATPMEF